MALQWMLWILLLKFSSPEESKSDTAGKSSSDGTYNHDTLITVVTRKSLPLFTSEDEHQTEPFQTDSEKGNKICITEKHLRGATVETSETVNIPVRRMGMTENSFKSLDVHNTEDLSALSTEAASLSQMLGGVDRPEFRERDLVLAYDAGYSQQAGLRDLLIGNPQQAVQINKTQDVLKIVSESSMCRGYPFLLDNPECLLVYTSNYNGSWNDHGSGRTRRSPVNTGAGGTYCDNCSLPLSLAIKADEDLTLVDLVSHLINLTSGRQFYLVYDDLIPGVEGLVRTFQKVMGDTILLPYDPNILLLTKVLRASYHVQPMRNVFILCSATHVLNLFEQSFRLSGICQSPGERRSHRYRSSQPRCPLRHQHQQIQVVRLLAHKLRQLSRNLRFLGLHFYVLLHISVLLLAMPTVAASAPLPGPPEFSAAQPVTSASTLGTFAPAPQLKRSARKSIKHD